MTELTQRLSSAIGDRYKVERHLGAGGMAIVYLAHDLKHERPVALKVLRPELAAVIGAERFLNEIRVTANLQHPHILPLHDSGEADTFLYYVMPFVEGETLREKLTREKQLSIDTATEITRSVAAALDYAHRHGVIHRDIKPENILLHDGQPLIADFGIALAVSAAGGTRLTETGLSVGTPHYMSPEQAMGDRELDARSDVYSLGAMLYEMLAGDPPYTGSTAQAIVAKVITEKAPAVTTHRDTVPAHIAAAVAKALNKLPADRFRSAAEFAAALGSPAFSAVLPGAAVPAAARPARRVPWRAAALVLGGVAAGGSLATLALRPRAPDPQVVRFTLDPGGGSRPSGRPWGVSPVAVAPDGQSVVFESDGRLVLRPFDRLAGTAIAGTDGGNSPFFSPDGRWVAFFASNELRKVPISGGPPITLADSGMAFCSSGSWGDDGAIVFVAASELMGTAAACRFSTLWRVPSGGGARERLTPVDSLHRGYYPSALPGARGVLFTRCTPDCAESALAVWDARGGAVRELIPEATVGSYVDGGYLVYAQASGAVFGVRFDLGSLEVRSAPISLLDGVFAGGLLSVQMQVSRSGDLAYVPGGATGGLRLALLTREGSERILDAPEGTYTEPRLSPDGQRIAVGIQARSQWHIGIYDLASSTLTRLTVGPGATQPVWAADGRRVAYSLRDSAGLWSIAWQPADGSAPAELVASTPLTSYRAWDLAFSRDGKWLVAAGNPGGQDKDIFAIPLTGDRKPVAIVATRANESDPAVSPDGRWLAHESNESGTTEVYVRPFPGPGGRWVVSQNGGGDPKWGPSGRELLYSGSPTSLVSERIGESERLQMAVLRFDPFAVVGRSSPFTLDNYVSDFDMSNDGRTIATVRASATALSVPVVVLHWRRELERRFAEQGGK